MTKSIFNQKLDKYHLSESEAKTALAFASEILYHAGAVGIRGSSKTEIHRCFIISAMNLKQFAEKLQ